MTSSARAAWIRSALAGAGLVLAAAGARAQTGAVPVRVIESATLRTVDLDTLAAAAAAADVVFIGEQHDDVHTHRVERQILEAVDRRRADVALALEMFERDVQEPLLHFSMGHVDEADFLAEARPWPQYARDYKPLVDFAIARNWALVAANVPRDIAAAVSASGLETLTDRPAAERAWFAADRQCAPEGPYFDRFRDAMTGHEAGTPALDAAAMARYYASQCLKDETMAQSIAEAYAAGATGGRRPLVISVNGAFHSDYGQGLVERTRRRLDGRRTIVVTVLPVADAASAAPDADTRRRADWLVYVSKDAAPR